MKIAIGGNIGVGKTTLCKKITEELKNSYLSKEKINYELLEAFYIANAERIEDIDNQKLNFFNEAEVEKIRKLPKKEFELANQHFFVSSTSVREFLDKCRDYDYIITDRPNIENVGIFAKTNLESIEYFDYLGYFAKITKDLKLPKNDITIILTCEKEENKKRVVTRGRNQEAHMDWDYHSKLGEMYLSENYKELLENWSKKVFYLDVTNLNENEVLEKTLEIIKKNEK